MVFQCFRSSNTIFENVPAYKRNGHRATGSKRVACATFAKWRARLRPSHLLQCDNGSDRASPSRRWIEGKKSIMLKTGSMNLLVRGDGFFLT